MYPSKKIPSIGQMNRRLTLKRPTFLSDGAGGSTVTYTNVRTFWVYAEQLRASEINEDGSAEIEQNWRFVGRFSATDILKGDILSFEGRDVRIHSLDIIDGKDRFIELKGYKTGLEKKTTTVDGGTDSSGGGGGSIPIINADNGGLVEPDPSGRFYVLTYHNVANSSLSVYIDKQATIDWGDGSAIMHYPGDHLISKTYRNAGNDPILIKVYWEVATPNTCKVIYFMPEGNSTAVLDSLTGDMPTDLWRINLAHGWSNIPYNLLPNTVKYWSLRWCSFTAVQMDELVTWCNTNVGDIGFLNFALQTTGESPDSAAQDYIDLQFKGWTIEA